LVYLTTLFQLSGLLPSNGTMICEWLVGRKLLRPILRHPGIALKGLNKNTKTSVRITDFHVKPSTWTFSIWSRTDNLFFNNTRRIFTLLTGSTATGAPLSARRIRILPMNQNAWRPITFGIK
jgi:hypothetical protein